MDWNAWKNIYENLEWKVAEENLTLPKKVFTLIHKNENMNQFIYTKPKALYMTFQWK